MKSGFHNCCKKCRAEDAKEYRAKNPEKTKESRLKTYAKHKDKYNEKRKIRYQNDPKFKAKRKAMDLRYRKSGARKKENRSAF